MTAKLHCVTMQCKECGYKGDDVQDFISTSILGQRFCPNCGSEECYMLDTPCTTTEVKT